MIFKTIARMCRITTAHWAIVLVFSVAACSEREPRTETYFDFPKQVKLAGGGTLVLNYTPWYIHTVEISGPPDSGIRGGGPNVLPMREDGRPSGGAKETCCTTYPAEWQSDLKLTVRWLTFKDVKKLGANAPGNWYKAENVRIPYYSKQIHGVWAIYLPDDRIRIMVTDGDHDGGNNPNNRPPDDDPYIAQGVIDDEWNDLFPNGVARGVE